MASESPGGLLADVSRNRLAYAERLELEDALGKTTGSEPRVTVLGHLQRGGTPTAFDRWLAKWRARRCSSASDRPARMPCMVGEEPRSPRSPNESRAN